MAQHGMSVQINKLLTTLVRYYKAGLSQLELHPVMYSTLVGLTYLLIFQWKFVTTGDIWAETHVEYLDNAIRGGGKNIFSVGWAGYLTIIPSLLARIYVVLGLPIGYIDYFYKLIIVAFSVSCTAIISSKFFVPLFKVRVAGPLTGLSILLLLNDISIFSFINIWYLGLILLCLVSLTPQKLTRSSQIAYAGFGIVMALTKPSLIILPFVIYRAFRCKEYMSNVVIALAVVAQSLIMVFLDPRASASNATHDLVLITQASFVGGGTELIKMFGIVPTNYFYVLTANIVIILLLITTYRRLGKITALLLLFGYYFSVYSYLLAPDAVVFKGVWDYTSIYFYNLKSQREFLAYAFLVIMAAISLPVWVNWLTNNSKKLQRVTLLMLLIGISVGVLSLFKPLDTESAGIAANIDGFRHSMNIGQTACVPIPPTPKFSPGENWVLAVNTDLCHGRNFNLTPDFRNMRTPLVKEQSFVIQNDTKYRLRTVYLVILNRQPHYPAKFILKDTGSRMQFFGEIPARVNESINFIPINVSGLPYGQAYKFTLQSESKDLYWGKFQGSETPLYYAYFAWDNRYDHPGNY